MSAPALAPVGVRALCEYAAKAGDLDLRFTPSATALEGMAGHAVVAARRGADYRAEVMLSSSHRGLLVRGRADGVDPARPRVDEVKVYRGELHAMPANRRALHWAQARVYGHMLCESEGHGEVELALVYLDAASQEETVLTERACARELRVHFESLCERYAAWAEQEALHAEQRREVLGALRFPHGSFRAGQRKLAVSVWKAAKTGRSLMAQAPTGIGKTAATLFPMLKAMADEAVDKLVYLCAKGTGRALALEGLAQIGVPEQPVRVLELVSRETACEHPGRACHGESCPLARGFYDRLPAARAEAAGAGWLDRSHVRELASRHAVCPYYLAQEMARWADVIVGDYNYWFDAHAFLHGLATAQEWKTGVLVDEAHNLVERARAMYSAELNVAQLEAALKHAPAQVAPSLARLLRAWKDWRPLGEGRDAGDDSQGLDRGGRGMSADAHSAGMGGGTGAGISTSASMRTRPLAAEAVAGYAVIDALPDPLARALQQGIAAVADYLADAAPTAEGASEPPGPGSPLLRWHFDALRFQRLLESFGDHSLLEAESEDAAAAPLVRIRNVVPASFLRPRLATAHSATLFAATLTPFDYYSRMLGLPEDTVELDVPSPYDARQLQVHASHAVSTRLAHRPRSLAPIAAIMASQFAREPGNYLAFFSSFDYMDRACEALRELDPLLPVWRQQREMDDAARAEFLARFKAGGRGIGFAVLGGAFGEGVDLPGQRLVGAFIATLGLPPVSAANEQVRLRLEELFGEGYAYAYLVPGVTKVVQAAGRVIRSPEDRGTLHLIDDRYGRREVRVLLPAWWELSKPPRAWGRRGPPRQGAGIEE